MITRLPTKFGQGHSDAIAFFQDVVLPALIENKIVTISLRGILDSGDELAFTMLDMSGERQWNLRLAGQVAELQADITAELAATK